MLLTFLLELLKEQVKLYKDFYLLVQCQLIMLLDTNLLSAIDNIFEKITPETDTALGDIVSVLSQFGIPAVRCC